MRILSIPRNTYRASSAESFRCSLVEQRTGVTICTRHLPPPLPPLLLPLLLLVPGGAAAGGGGWGRGGEPPEITGIGRLISQALGFAHGSPVPEPLNVPERSCREVGLKSYIGMDTSKNETVQYCIDTNETVKYFNRVVRHI